jgi:RimJ/RimL family protein N-acetyltransferase
VHPQHVRRLADDRVVGQTTFLNIDQTNRHVEIGATWLGLTAQRTAVNTAAKLLLLGHAFESCDAIAVEFRTHWHNRQSRAAIARLGAKQDGVLRSHQLGRDGTIRDTVVFSIIAMEWPAVRLGLRERLERAETTS